MLRRSSQMKTRTSVPRLNQSGFVVIPTIVKHFPISFLAWTRHYGTVTKRETRRQVNDLMSAEQIPLTLYWLIDMSGFEESDINFVEMYSLGLSLDPLLDRQVKGINISICAPSDYAYGMARMVEQLVNGTGRNTAVVSRDLVPAIENLGMDYIPPEIGLEISQPLKPAFL